LDYNDLKIKRVNHRLLIIAQKMYESWHQSICPPTHQVSIAGVVIVYIHWPLCAGDSTDYAVSVSIAWDVYVV